MPKLITSYPGGIPSLIPRWRPRRTAVVYPEGGPELPPLDVDLEGLSKQIITAPGATVDKDAKRDFARMHQELGHELAGHTELARLNGLLIINLRKNKYPKQTPALFRKLWAEWDDHLLQDLPNRWLISSVITFETFGQTEADRRLAASLNVLFSLMKLYEAERLYSGIDPTEPHRIKDRITSDLPLGMPPFALLDGDLDGNLLVPLWRAAQDAPGVGKLARHLLVQLNWDDRNVFRRIAEMRERAKPDPEVGTL